VHARAVVWFFFFLDFYEFISWVARSLKKNTFLIASFFSLLNFFFTMISAAALASILLLIAGIVIAFVNINDKTQEAVR
jgi:hypothetical protein